MESPKQPLIILSTWTNLVMGGGELFLGKLLKLQQSFFNIFLISKNHTVNQFLKNYTSSFEDKKELNNFLYVLSSLITLRKKLGFNVTIVLNGQGAFYYSLFCKLLFKKVVSIQHQQFQAETNIFKRQIKKISLIFSNIVVVVSNPLAYELRFVLNKVIVINNWVEISFKDKFKDFQYDSSGEILKLIYIARIEENKGIKDLVSVISKIDNIHLTILGIGTLTDWILSLNLQDKITLIGWQTDIIPYVKKVHLLIQPSYVEGLPFVPIEMGVAGLPALLSDIPVHKEISKGGNYSFLFKTGSRESLESQLLTIQRDRNLLIDMSEKIKIHYQANYLESDKFINAYRKAFEIS